MALCLPCHFIKNMSAFHLQFFFQLKQISQNTTTKKKKKKQKQSLSNVLNMWAWSSERRRQSYFINHEEDSGCNCEEYPSTATNGRHPCVCITGHFQTSFVKHKVCCRYHLSQHLRAFLGITTTGPSTWMIYFIYWISKF